MSDDCQCPICGRMHRHLGTPLLSVSEQIARDMKQGTFPQKSKDTLLEEAADRIEALEAALREIETLEAALTNTTAHLAAAISLLERTPKAKKAAASDKIFDIMLDDYRKALAAARAALLPEQAK